MDLNGARKKLPSRLPPAAAPVAVARRATRPKARKASASGGAKDLTVTAKRDGAGPTGVAAPRAWLASLLTRGSHAPIPPRKSRRVTCG